MTNLVNDNGPQFRSDFKHIGALHETSSPYFPQSNGQAKSAVKNAKYMLIKSIESGTDFQLALAEFRRVPRGDKYSPAQLMFGFQQRGLLPSLAKPSIDIREAEEARNKERARQKQSFDTGSRSLPPLAVGDRVLVQHPLTKRWDNKATIASVTDTGRSYEIIFTNGRQTRRNRRFLKKFSYADCTKLNLNLHPTHPKTDMADKMIRQPKNSILKSPDADTLTGPRRSPRLASKKSVHYAA